MRCKDPKCQTLRCPPPACVVFCTCICTIFVLSSLLMLTVNCKREPQGNANCNAPRTPKWQCDAKNLGDSLFAEQLCDALPPCEVTSDCDATLLDASTPLRYLSMSPAREDAKCKKRTGPSEISCKIQVISRCRTPRQKSTGTIHARSLWSWKRFLCKELSESCFRTCDKSAHLSLIHEMMYNEMPAPAILYANSVQIDNSSNPAMLLL